MGILSDPQHSLTAEGFQSLCSILLRLVLLSNEPMVSPVLGSQALNISPELSTKAKPSLGIKFLTVIAA